MVDAALPFLIMVQIYATHILLLTLFSPAWPYYPPYCCSCLTAAGLEVLQRYGGDDDYSGYHLRLLVTTRAYLRR